MLILKLMNSGSGADTGSVPDGKAVAGSRREVDREGSSGWGVCPSFFAHNPFLRSPVPSTITANSGDLGGNGRSGVVEDARGSKRMVLAAPSSGMSGNGGQLNSGNFPSDGAVLVLDKMSNRDSILGSVLDVVLEEGESWEKGPELLGMEGNQVKGIYRQPRSEGVGPMKLTPVKGNAENTQSSSAVGKPTDDLDHLAGVLRIAAHAPELVRVAAGCNPANSEQLTPANFKEDLSRRSGLICLQLQLSDNSTGGLGTPA